MIDIEKVRIAVFDFDDTLCIHTKHSKYETIPNYIQRCISGEFPWDHVYNDGSKACIPSTVMRKFINMLKLNNVKLFMCSATSMSLIGGLKTEWSSREYNCEFKDVSVNSWEQKVSILRHLAEINHYDSDRILIVDDYFNVLDYSGAEGFQTASPIEVAEFLIQNGFDLQI